VRTVEGWALPGLVDAHCHVGLDGHGPVDAGTSEKQALTDRQAGALLLRDAGSPSDTRWIDDREDLPRIIRAGRHIARTRRYIRNYAHEIEPGDLTAYVRAEARRGDGWVKLVGDWIDRETGDLEPCWPRWALDEAIAAAHAEGARVTAHCFSENSLADLVGAGIDCVEHATGLTEDTVPLFAELGVAIVPTLVNIATFPQIAASAEAKFPTYAGHVRALHERRYATVACSMQSMPAPTRSASEFSLKQCAVTRAPSAWAAAMASSSAHRGQQGSRSPLARSIQSPTSFTQPSPRRASART
jgi:hypothetical protein